MQPQANGLHHLGLRVADIEASKRFYIDSLGFQSVRDVDGLSLIQGHGVIPWEFYAMPV
jgi:catechol 2,3-dioxygenase-like lactoylglutathione lyase family enzyme